MFYQLTYCGSHLQLSKCIVCFLRIYARWESSKVKLYIVPVFGQIYPTAQIIDTGWIWNLLLSNLMIGTSISIFYKINLFYHLTPVQIKKSKFSLFLFHSFLFFFYPFSFFINKVKYVAWLWINCRTYKVIPLPLHLFQNCNISVFKEKTQFLSWN